ncbi:PAS domain-containing protein [Calothrix sp. FACHB-156]|nr:PAS domain-containing protein [Calothrix sp. FACHB-156]
MRSEENSIFSEQIGLIDRVLAASTDHIYISDRNLRYLYASPASLAALGLEQGQLLGKTWQELGFPADIMEVYDLQRQSVLQTGIPIRGETSFPTVNGVRYYEYVISPIEGNEGEIQAVITTTRDITERQQAEDALRLLTEELEARITAKTQDLAAVNESLRREIAERQKAEQASQESEMRFSALVDAMFEGIVIQERGKIIEANPGFAKMFGYSLEEVLGKSAVDFLTPESVQSVLHYSETQYELPYEITGIKKDGTSIQLEVVGKQSWYQGRSVRISAARDITERKRTEAALKENQIQLQRQLAEIETIYQSAPIGLSILDPDLRFVRINDRLAQMNGFAIDAHIGRTVKELLPNLADAAEQLLRSILTTGKPVINIEITGETPAQPGVQRTWLESFLPLKDSERIIGISVVCEEITERKRAQQSLQESEATLRLFAQYAPAGIAMFDKDMRYIIASQRWVDEYHLDSVESLIGRSHYEIFPEISDKWRQIHQRCLAGNSEKCDEDLFIRADGTQQWISWEIHPWHTATGEIGGIIIFGDDITPQKQAKEALRKSEYLYRTLAHNFPNGGVNIFDHDLRYLLSDGTEIAKVGMTKEQLEGHTLWETVPPETSAVLEPPYRAALAGETTIFELSFGESTYQVHTLPLFNEQGEIFAGLSMSQNITLQKQAEQTLKMARDELELQVQERTKQLRETNAILQKREREFRTLVENTPDIISRHDRQYRYVYVNPASTQQSGIPIETYLGKTQSELGYPQEMTDFWTASLESVFTKGQMRIDEFRVTQQDEWKAYQTYVVPELGLDGEVESVLTITRDITELREAEQSSRKLAEELQRSNQELEQFAYVASHDLQEPLRAVTSFTQMLAKRYQGQLDAKADMYIEFIVDGASRMQQLVRDLLAYSRAGRYELKLQSVDCNTLLEQLKKDLQISITETQALITAEPLPTVLADPRQMSNLLLNLLSNSLKYRSELPPKVYISAQKNTLPLTDLHFAEKCNPLCATFQEEWIFMVQDNGIGIEPQYAERIFGIFQRLHASDEYSGTGLGLAICKKIVERHSGRIWVESQLGQGATFYFTLPIGNENLICHQSID